MITTLVPAFKPEHFLPLLSSLAGQRVKADRVIFSDDSTDNDFVRMALQNNHVRTLLRDVNGTIMRGPKSGYHDNVRHLIGEYRKQPTEFFHILLDDDEIAPNFYEDHIHAHGRHRTLCCVSRRYVFRSADRHTGILAMPDDIVDGSSAIVQISLDQLVQSLVIEGKWNWLGELSCMTIRQGFLDLDPDFNTLDGIGLEGLNDVGTLLKCATVSDVIFLTEPKGLFRIHANSISERKGYFYSLSILAALPLAILLRRRGKLGTSGVLGVANRVRAQWQDIYGRDVVIERLSSLMELLPHELDAFEQGVLAVWRSYKELSARSGTLSTRPQLMSFLAGADLSAGQEGMPQ